MIKTNAKTSLCAALASCALPALVSAQRQAAPEITKPAATNVEPGTVVIHHGGERIVIKLPAGQKPSVEINGEVLPAESLAEKEGTFAGVAGAYSLQLTPPVSTHAKNWGGAIGFMNAPQARLPKAHWPKLPSAPGPFFAGKDGTVFARPAAPKSAARKMFDASLGNVFGDQRSAGEDPVRPQIGVQVGSVPDALAEYLELDPSSCVLILNATEGGPAAAAGLKKNDVLIRVGDHCEISDASLRKIVGEQEPDDVLRMRVLRRGEEHDFDVVVGAAPTTPAYPEYAQAVDWRHLGGSGGAGSGQPVVWPPAAGGLPDVFFMNGGGSGGEPALPKGIDLSSVEGRLEAIEAKLTELCRKLDVQDR
ncbi:MAG: PDZ domain-containing protein [Planctomycetota bacterium]